MTMKNDIENGGCEQGMEELEESLALTNHGRNTVVRQGEIPGGGVERKGPGVVTGNDDYLQNGSSNSSNSNNTAATASKQTSRCGPRRPCCRAYSPWLMSVLIFGIGCLAATIILAFGIKAAKREQESNFKTVSSTLFVEFGVTLAEYVRAGQWIHHAFRRHSSGEQSSSSSNSSTSGSSRPRRNLDDFMELYENIVSDGLQCNGLTFAINVSHAEREELENETRTYLLESYPEMGEKYRGFLAFGENGLEPRSNASSFYMVVHYVAPVEVVGPALDTDLYTSPPRKKAIDLALATWKPIMTAPLEVGYQLNSNIRSVVLVHPGLPLASDPSVVPRDLSFIGIRIPHVIDRTRLKLPHLDHKISMYIFDSTDSSHDPIFLGGATLNNNNNNHNGTTSPSSTISINATSNTAQDSEGLLEFSPEMELSTLLEKKNTYHDLSRHSIASREWTFLIMADQEDSPDGILYVVLSAVMIFVACTCTALWVYTSYKRAAKIHQIKCKAAAEKAAFMVESAQKAARDERWMNDFISHEVRNPCAAAISACSFVSSAVHESEPLMTRESRDSVREDVTIIETSLNFINDLLRNMLDMHRAASHQLIINNSHVDILHDILHPVSSMLYRRDCSFEVVIDCPPHLYCYTDRLRLKQIIMNLGRNAAKFVCQGFIRFRVEVKGCNADSEKPGSCHDETGAGGSICIYVDDSGPGIPVSKRDRLFEKFQESLDTTNQGTGIGLCVCKHLTDLMNAEIWLDAAYDSGVPGCPGTRFVVDLKIPRLPVESVTSSAETADLTVEEIGDSAPSPSQQQQRQRELPQTLSVLIVDDEMILRKLFHRSIKKAIPGVIVTEASNGETAIRYVDEGQKFDMIFMDQYMSGVERCRLGTETVRELRARGTETTIITGLSANDLESAFIEAGANAFTMKPFPCQPTALKAELLRIWNTGDHELGGA